MATSSIGSSLIDVNSIVSQLMTVEQRPLTLLASKEASYQAKLSAFGNIKSSLSAFQTSVAALSDISKFRTYQTSVGDSTILSASASSTATPGTYSVEVTQLAQAQTLVSAGQASAATSVGNGTLTFDFGTISGGAFNSGTGLYTGSTFTSNGSGTKTVTIDATNNSLQGIASAINAAEIGITATIVNDGTTGSPYRLSLASTSGAANSIKVSVSGDAALSNLIAHDPSGTQNLSETLTAKNSNFKVNGISISKSTNTISDVISGISLNLLKTNSGSPTTLAVKTDTAAVQSSVQSFVTAYNNINGTLADLSAYDATTKKAALLQGDSTVRTIQTQLRSILNSTLTGNNGTYTLLSQVGVTFQKDGKLALDSSKLQTAMDTNFNDIAGLFAAVGKPSDGLISYVSSTTNTDPGAYAVNITQLATQGNSVGSALANLTITQGVNDTLNVTLDNVSATVTIAAGAYGSASALATAVQSAINGKSDFSSAGDSVTVTESAGVLTITSNRYGSSSNVTVTGGNGKTDLLGATTTDTVGVDTQGTIGGAAASGSGQYLTGATGTDTEGLKLLITGGSTGSRGTVNFSKGYAYQLNELANTILDSEDGVITSRTDGINASIEDISKQREEINRRLISIEARYRAQFTALDSLVSSLQTTSNFLTQQLANLPKIGGS